MRYLIIYLFCVTVVFQVQAQGIDFFDGTWQEALTKAENQEKIIFVDAFAQWCGPCKRMAKTVFPNAEVGKFFNSNFINLKLDMERGEGLKFRQKYPVSAFPTLFFIDGKGEIVLQVRGARQVEGFIELGKQALSKVDRSEQYAEKYNAGDHSPELVYKYVKALNNAGKSSLKVVNEYLKTKPDFSEEINLKFILEATTVADSRIFDMLIKHRKQVVAVTSEEIVNERILSACEKTVERAIEYQNEELLTEAKNKMKKYYPEKAASFALQEDMHFCLALNEVENYLGACKKYAKKEAKGDPKELEGLAVTILQHFASKSEAMMQAENLAKEAAKIGGQYGYYLTYAKILEHNGKKAEAVDAAKKSLELAADEQDRTKKMIQGFIRNIQRS